MDSRERITRMLQHKEADRIAITDIPWNGTVRNWIRQGMPADADWRDFFGVDKFETFRVDISPRYERRVLEETSEYRIVTTEWGATMKEFVAQDSTPEFLDYKINTPRAWEEAKARMTFDESRLRLDVLRKAYPEWKKSGAFTAAQFWFGFDVTHSWASGTETVLIAMLEDPEWVVNMFNHYLDLNIALFDRLWEMGYTFDAMRWPDDMGYKNSQFFSVQTYRELLKPVHRRAVNWAKEKGIFTILHSCGDITPFVPEFVEIGIDALNPLEVKAGVNSLELKEKFGSKLCLFGGLDALHWHNTEFAVSEIRRIVPVLKQNGGYICSSDHSIPNDVTVENYRAIVQAAKECGRY